MSAAAGYSESAAYRHIRHHMRPELRKSLRQADAPLDVSDFGARLVALLNDSATVRQHAVAVGDGRLLLQAGAHERDTLAVLLNRLGIDSEEVLDVLDEARQLARALRTVLPHHPDACMALVRELHRLGLTEAARALVQVCATHVAEPNNASQDRSTE
ncbi:hypothetical protein G7072_04040 [Nocardioides sp. HDW12B]|uniref:hypothetical protein n=1 Tax=Nocardioides sp. HDW12B TaxID=2714939 RepID=UPI00140E5975|nr:hypothetical protein [Nocardioides sp. HDW12B]QIK65617.1 hypothetical protein G7072_04040 [Nocardioides sp. HDW12B]